MTDFIEISNKTKHTNYPIVNKRGICYGLLRLIDIGEVNRDKVILVDHNEAMQSVEGLDEAEILEIIDHHNISDINTNKPINFRNMAVGSVNTIIYYMYKENNIDIPNDIAGLMISGIISDTVLLNSPTTTYNDEFVLKVKDSNVDFVLKMGYSRSKPYIYQVITINGKQMPIAVSGKVLYDEDGKLLLKIHIVYLEEVADRVIKLYFMEDKVRLKAYETPDLIRFMNKFIGDDMFNKAKRLKDMMSPDYLDYKVKKILRPDVIGYIDN